MVVIHHEPPVVPPIVQGCAYQVKINTVPDTFKCYTAKEWQDKQDAKMAQEEQWKKERKETTKWIFSQWWGKLLAWTAGILGGLFILFILALFFL